MPAFHAKSAKVLVDEFDFSGVMSSVRINVANPTPDATAFADGDQVFVEGKPQFAIDQNGLHSLSSPNYDGEMFTDLTALARRLGIYPEGFATVGDLGYEGRTNSRSQARQSRVNQAILLNVSWRGDKPLITATVLYRDSAAAASANGTALNLGSVSASQKATGVLRLLAAPGGAGNNTLDVTVESDSQEDFLGSKETQLTFAQLDQASVALHEVVEANGSITDTWWRVVLTYAGAGSRTFNLLLTVGIGPQ